MASATAEARVWRLPKQRCSTCASIRAWRPPGSAWPIPGKGQIPDPTVRVACGWLRPASPSACRADGDCLSRQVRQGMHLAATAICETHTDRSRDRCSTRARRGHSGVTVGSAPAHTVGSGAGQFYGCQPINISDEYTQKLVLALMDFAAHDGVNGLALKQLRRRAVVSSTPSRHDTIVCGKRICHDPEIVRLPQTSERAGHEWNRHPPNRLDGCGMAIWHPE